MIKIEIKKVKCKCNRFELSREIYDLWNEESIYCHQFVHIYLVSLIDGSEYINARLEFVLYSEGYP